MEPSRAQECIPSTARRRRPKPAGQVRPAKLLILKPFQGIGRVFDKLDRMTGKLILVSGLSGAGKTTLIAHALRQIPGLAYLKTYTTRPIRSGEEHSHEYVFVSEHQYDELRRKAVEWDHTVYSGFYYGADAADIKVALAEGKQLICSVAPDLSVTQEMANLYETQPVTIWIEVPQDVAKQRIHNDNIRESRIEHVAMSAKFDHIFEPIGNIEVDTASFVELLRTILE